MSKNEHKTEGRLEYILEPRNSVEKSMFIQQEGINSNTFGKRCRNVWETMELILLNFGPCEFEIE